MGEREREIERQVRKHAERGAVVCGAQSAALRIGQRMRACVGVWVGAGRFFVVDGCGCVGVCMCCERVRVVHQVRRRCVAVRVLLI